MMKACLGLCLLCLTSQVYARSIADRTHHLWHNWKHGYHVSRLWYHCADLQGPTPCRPHERPVGCDIKSWQHPKVQHLHHCTHS